MKRIRLFLILWLLGTAGLRAAEVPIPPSPARWVTDTAGFLSPEVRDSVDRGLEGYEKATGHQVLVWIGPTTGDTPTEDWTIKAFTKWKVGRKGLDDGLVLFLFPQDKKVRIEVGYGLEDKVPDAIASRIIRETIVPHIQAGDNNGAVVAGVQALMNAIQPPEAGTLRDEDSEPVRQPAKGRPLSPLEMIGLAILGIAFLWLLITHPSIALWLLFSLLSGGRGGGGGGGGGFSGGGGGGGGGGATGSW